VDLFLCILHLLFLLQLGKILLVVVALLEGLLILGIGLEIHLLGVVVEISPPLSTSTPHLIRGADFLLNRASKLFAADNLLEVAVLNGIGAKYCQIKAARFIESIGESVGIGIGCAIHREEPCFLIHLCDESVVATLSPQLLLLGSDVLVVLGPSKDLAFAGQLQLVESSLAGLEVVEEKDVASPSCKRETGIVATG
jgi:hypothetical protein